MRICDIPEDQIKVGMRIRSLVDPNKLGTIVEKNIRAGDIYFCILWDGDKEPYSGFYFNDCECEVVELPS